MDKRDKIVLFTYLYASLFTILAVVIKLIVPDMLGWLCALFIQIVNISFVREVVYDTLRD